MLLLDASSLSGIPDASKKNSKGTQNQFGTLITFGGGRIGGRLSSKPPGNGDGSRFAQLHDHDDENYLELDALRIHQHHVAVTTQGYFEGQQKLNDTRSHVDAESEDGILITSRTTVISESKV